MNVEAMRGNGADNESLDRESATFVLRLADFCHLCRFFSTWSINDPMLTLRFVPWSRVTLHKTQTRRRVPAIVQGNG